MIYRTDVFRKCSNEMKCGKKCEVQMFVNKPVSKFYGNARPLLKKSLAKLRHRTLTVRGSNTVLLTPFLTGLDFTKQVKHSNPNILPLTKQVLSGLGH